MEHKLSNKNTAIKRVIKWTVISIVIYATFLFFGDFQGVKQTLSKISFTTYALCFVCAIFSYLLRAIKWNYLINCFKVKVPLKENTEIFLIGLFLSVTPGKIGELIKSYTLNKLFGIKFTSSTSAIISDHLTNVFAWLFMIGCTISFFSINYESFLVLLFITLGSIIILQNKKLIKKIIRLLTKNKFLSKNTEDFILLYENIIALLKTKPFIITFKLSVLVCLLECVPLFLITSSLEMNISFVSTIFILGIGTIAGALSMLPGGIGVLEGSVVGILVYFGSTKALAVSVSLLERLVVLWFGVLIGLLILLIRHKKYL